MQGALANLGHTVSSSTVANILKRHGIEPAPERGKRTSWRTFLKAHSVSVHFVVPFVNAALII